MSFETEKLSTDRDVLAKQLLADAEERFDMDEVQANEEIYRLLSDIQDFAEKDEVPKITGEVIVENEFDEPAFDNLTEKLDSAFSKELLERCLISRITIRTDIVHLAIGKGLYLTRDEYESWQQENPRIDEFKVRAENFTTFQTSGWLRENFGINEPIPLPIVVYGFKEGEGNNVAHLDSAEPDTREQLYKFGTVTHEIGHHVFQFVLTPELKDEFKELATDAIPLTEYAKLYRDKSVYSEEQFCEAVRLMTTNPTYLKESAPELFKWFVDVLPDIHPAVPSL
jgi:hypothetical protein